MLEPDCEDVLLGLFFQMFYFYSCILLCSGYCLALCAVSKIRLSFNLFSCLWLLRTPSISRKTHSSAQFLSGFFNNYLIIPSTVCHILYQHQVTGLFFLSFIFVFREFRSVVVVHQSLA